MSWEDRQQAFAEVPTPAVGAKLIWFKGGGARNRKEEQLSQKFRERYHL